MAKTIPGQALVCLWCVKIIVKDVDSIPVEEAIGIIKSHDLVCPKTPLIIKNHALRNNKKRLTRGTSLN